MRRRRNPAQLDLFGDRHDSTTAGAAGDVRTAPADLAGADPVVAPGDAGLARRIPAGIRLGTSSWAFPGWAGLLYPGTPGARELARSGLGVYARHPLLRTVGVDRSHYAPLGAREWRAYAAQLPTGYRCVIKAWNGVTAARDPRTRDANPGFLDAGLFEDRVLGPIAEAFSEHAGPIVLEIPPMRKDEIPPPDAFAERVDRFLAGVRGSWRLAFELRNRELFGAAYLDALRAHGAAHVLSQWERMPPVGDQLAVPGVLTAPFVVCRALLPVGVRYDDARRRLDPFDRIAEPDESLRAGVEALAMRCLAEGRDLYVVVNNKAEGSAPLTVRAIAERIAARVDAGAGAT